jgi:formate-dependent nitrite reductase membrane component NrfD
VFTGITHSHHYIAYLLLLTAISTVAYAIYARMNNQSIGAAENKLSLITMILAHLQLLFGLILLVITYGDATAADIMKDADLRRLVIEHPSTMILSVLLFTLGRLKFKRAEGDNNKRKALIRYMGLGLALMLAVTPWDKLF